MRLNLTGVYIKYEIHIFPPNETLYEGDFLPQGKNCQAFFVLFCKYLVNWGKIMHTFYQLGKKYAFSPLFFIPFQSFPHAPWSQL